MKVNIHTHFNREGEVTLSIAGIHPYHAQEATTDTLLSLYKQCDDVEAIGEIGLDYSCNSDKQQQQLIFRAQLEVAQRYNKGVVLHCVRAFEPVMKILSDYNLKFVIFHGFIGSIEQAKRATERGYYLSFGERTFQSPKSIGALKSTPIERLFLETDESNIGIEKMYSKVADILGMPEAMLEWAINENFKQICG